MKSLRKPVDGHSFGTQFLSSSVGYQFRSLCRHADFQGQMGIGREGTKSLCFHLWQKRVGSINFPRMYTELYKILVYAFVIWSPFSQSTLKASRNRNNVCCDSSTYRIPYGPVVKEKMYFRVTRPGFESLSFP